MPERFYVVECEGWPIDPAKHTPSRSTSGLSVSVLDRLDAHREVAGWDAAGTGASLGKARIRAATAAAEAARLNASVR